jgi:hypothetical protein
MHRDRARTTALALADDSAEPTTFSVSGSCA